jgi:uncharacterized membrane protein YeaQ/YmgE (transglycosylase-associated protein family)
MIKAILFAILFFVIGVIAFALLTPLLIHSADFKKLGQAAFPVILLVCGTTGFILGWRRHTNTRSETKAFAYQAAQLSWICPIIMYLILVADKQISSPMILDLVALVLIVVGLIFGIIALSGISKHGSKGLLAPAIVGIIINGILLLIFVTNFMAARARAQQHTSIEASPVVAAWFKNSPEPLTPIGAVSPHSRLTDMAARLSFCR